MAQVFTKNLPENIESQLGRNLKAREKACDIYIYNFEASNIAADVVSSYIFSRTKLQVHTIVDKSVPSWIRDGDDVIIMSYRGTNKYIATLYPELSRTGARIHCITSGGDLRDLCEEHGDDLLLMPSGLSVFEATGYEVAALTDLYESMGVEGLTDRMREIIPRLKAYRDEMWDSE